MFRKVDFIGKSDFFSAIECHNFGETGNLIAMIRTIAGDDEVVRILKNNVAL